MAYDTKYFYDVKIWTIQKRQGGRGQKGASASPDLDLGEQEEQKCPFPNATRSFLDTYLKQQRSNELYKQANYNCKRKRERAICIAM